MALILVSFIHPPQVPISKLGISLYLPVALGSLGTGDIASIICFVSAIRALDMLLSMLVVGVYPSNSKAPDGLAPNHQLIVGPVHLAWNELIMHTYYTRVPSEKF